MANLDSGTRGRSAPNAAPKSLLAFPLLSRILPQDALNGIGLTKILIALMLSFKLQQSSILLITAEYATSPIRFPFMLIARLNDIHWLPVAALFFIVTNYRLATQHEPKVSVDSHFVFFRLAAIFLGIMLVFNLTEAPSDLYSQYSSSLITEGLPILFMFLCLRDHQGMRYFLGAMAFWGITTTVSYLLLGISPLTTANLSMISERLALGDNPITAAMYFCIAALSCILFAFVLTDKRAKRFYVGVLLASATYLFLCALLTNSRGPVVSFIACVIILFVIKYKSDNKNTVEVLSLFNKKNIASFLLLCGLFLVSYMFVNKVGMLLESFTRRDLGRLENIIYVFTSTPTLFGHGVGGFWRNTSIIYTHSCLAESYYEHGVIGLILYVTTVYGAMVVLYRRQMFFSDIPSMLPLLLFIFYVVESQFSGTLYDFMPLWALFICAAIPLTSKKPRKW